ncbi:MAG: hypothetical protein ABIE55_00660 [Candidatus Aenigmatarchaeota archaeon]
MSENIDISKRLESIENKLSELAHEIDMTKFKEELFEVLLIISTLKDKKKIEFYLNFFEKLIKVMKSRKLWDEVDEELLKDVLTGIAENWRDYKKEELAKLFESWLEKNIVGGD